MYEGWRILLKLSISVYIVHLLIIFWYYASIFQNGFIADRWLVFRTANGATILSYIFGVVFYLLIDKPIRNIDRLVLFPTKISDSFLVKKSSRSKGSSGGGPNRKREEDPGEKKKIGFRDKTEQEKLHYSSSIATDLAEDS